jgi:hypothetical protein
LINAFFKLITPFIDPVTREKMRFNPDVVKEELFTSDMVVEAWGGDLVLEYEHAKYWPCLVRLTEDLKKAYMERWRTLGGTVGIKEWDYKGGSKSEESKNQPSDEAADTP